MSIRYITTGDEFEARGLLGEGRHQLSILKNEMSFQKLQQLQRVVRFNDGTIIKCLSCFGQDVVDIYVPVGEEEEISRPIPLSKYYPAFEAYDGILWNSKFMGVVLCKGGGFEPPYEFIPKDSLPNDYSDEPMGELPEERIWWPEVDRRLQDIVPKGIADVEEVKPVDTQPSITSSGSYLGPLTRKEKEFFPTPNSYDVSYWKFTSLSGENHAYTRAENFRQDFTFGYIKQDDVNPGKWDEIWFEGIRHIYRKSSTLLNISANLYWDVNGSGHNNFICNHAIPQTVWDYTLKFVVDYILFGIPYGHWEYDSTVTAETTAAIALAQLMGRFGDDPPRSDYPTRAYMYMGDYYYTHSEDRRLLWDYWGSVMDENHFAVVYSLMNKRYVANNYRSITDQTKCIQMVGWEMEEPCLSSAKKEDVIKDESTEGPLCVAVDGVIFEVLSEAQLESSPRLQWAYLKYFRVGGGRSIGMFHIMKNYNYPLDYIYVYAEVQHGEGEPVNPEITQLVTTEVEEHSTYHVIPGVTDLDDNPLYGRGKFRLVYEELEPIIEKGG